MLVYRNGIGRLVYFLKVFTEIKPAGLRWIRIKRTAIHNQIFYNRKSGFGPLKVSIVMVFPILEHSQCNWQVVTPSIWDHALPHWCTWSRCRKFPSRQSWSKATGSSPPVLVSWFALKHPFISRKTCVLKISVPLYIFDHFYLCPCGPFLSPNF